MPLIHRRLALALLVLLLGFFAFCASAVFALLRDKTVRIHRHSGAIFARRAQASIAAHRWSQAIDELKESLRRRPRDREVELDLVFALEQAGRTEEAARYLQAHPRVWHGTELTAEEQRQREAPLPRHNPYDVEDEPDHISSEERRQMLATAARLIERAAFETSLQTMRCQVCHHRASTLSSRPVTEALFPDRQLLSEAVTLFTLVRGLTKGAEVARLNYEIGRAEFKLSELFPPKHQEAHQHLKRALEALQQAIGVSPRPPLAHMQRPEDWRYDALIYLGLAAMKAEQWPRAERAWRAATTLESGDARAWSNLGVLYSRRGDGVQARDMLKQAVAVDPENAALRTNLGTLLASRGRFDDALREHRRALELDANNGVARLNYALAFAQSGARHEARREIGETLRRHPNSAAAHNALGQMLLEEGDGGGAQQEFLLALKHNPAFAKAYRNLGRLHRRAGRHEQAREMFRHVLEWVPDDAEAKEALGP